MLDEKKIEEAVRVYILSKKVNETAYFQLRSIDDFKEGAHWAIQEFLKDLWHPAEEEPTAYKNFVYLKSNQETGVTSRLPSFDWGNMVHNIGITYWYYLDDLLEQKEVSND